MEFNRTVRLTDGSVSVSPFLRFTAVSSHTMGFRVVAVEAVQLPVAAVPSGAVDLHGRDHPPVAEAVVQGRAGKGAATVGPDQGRRHVVVDGRSEAAGRLQAARRVPLSQEFGRFRRTLIVAEVMA